MLRRTLSTLAIIAPALVGALFFGLETANANRVAHHLKLPSGPAIGGMEHAQARAAVGAHAETIRGLEVAFTRESFSATRTFEALGVSLDENATFAQAWSYGRKEPLFAALAAQLSARLIPQTLIPQIRVDDETFAAALNELFRGIDQPAQDARLAWNADRSIFLDVPETYGTVADRAAVREALLFSAAAGTPADVAVRMVTDAPNVTQADLPDARQRAEAALSRAPRTLEAGDFRAALDKNDVAPWIAFTARRTGASRTLHLALNREAVRAYLDNTVAPRVNREPVNARFRMESGRVVTFALARSGQTLNLDQAIAIIEGALLGNEALAGETLALPVAVTPPEVGNDAAESLGIRELLAVGETDFRGSPANRIHNIRVGASRYDGVLIKPGEEFSFNTLLGSVGAETGYKPELVIKQDKTVPEYGGGLCQVSTTAFRAAVNAGLTITERRNHAYIVRYYGTPGFDATIYPPHPDLRFVNDTPGHILVQTQVVGTKLRFAFYGTDDGRSVEVIGPKVYDRKEDGSAKATLTLRVAMPDGTVREQVFRSAYKSPALYPVEKRNPLE